jgi:hypothetical protein
VPGFSMYEASSEGRVRSWLESEHHGPVPRVLAQSGRADGSKYLQLEAKGDDGRRTTLSVHRTVLLAFTGEPGAGQECCHCDGNPRNNKPENLRWDTRGGNAADRDAHGTTPRGVRHGMSKLNDDLVREIRERAKRETAKAIAESIGVSRSLVYQVAAKTIWRHVA